MSLLWLGVLPQALFLLALDRMGLATDNWFEGYGMTMTVEAVWALLGRRGRRLHPLPLGIILAGIVVAAGGLAGGLADKLYRPDQAALVICLGALSVAALCYLLMRTRVGLRPGWLGPLTAGSLMAPVAAALMPPWREMRSLLLALGAGCLALGLCFMARWMLAFIYMEGIPAQAEARAPLKHRVKSWLTSADGIVVFGLALPLIGLALNQYGFGKISNILGDFSSPWFYILAVVNGVAMLPIPGPTPWLLARLYLRCLGLVYVLYFAVCLFPLFPMLAFVGLALMIGCPLWAPYVLLAVKCIQFKADLAALRGRTARWKAALAISLGLATLPMALTGSLVADHLNFDRALAGQNQVDPKRLERTLDSLAHYTAGTSGALAGLHEGLAFSDEVPLVAWLRAWSVTGGGIPSRATQKALRERYLGQG